ncbi:MAG: hypothetical protein ACOYK9_06905 [Chlamydiia bacterium]
MEPDQAFPALDFTPFQQVPSSAYSQFLIRRSLGLDDANPLTEAHVQRAVKKALRSPLRQTVGSCFATSVAILIQQERLDLFLKDLEQILYFERLIRVVEGHECIAPISPFYEGGDPLLKAWEFTIASLSDYNHSAYRQNFHSSLGLDPHDPEGLGRVLWDHFEKNYTHLREEYEKKSETIRHHESLLNGAQMRLNSAYREEDIRRIQGEVQTENFRLDGLELDAHEIKKKLLNVQDGSKLFFEELELGLLKEFYEVYDPAVEGAKAEIFADSEAGFRLVWKNGLKNTGQHLRIEDVEGYLLAIKEFFISFERRMMIDHPQLAGLVESSGVIVSQHIHSVPFRRRIETKKPWAYPSGGSLEMLLEGYFEKKGPMQIEMFRPQNPLELFVFYLDLMKSLSADTLELFQKNPKKRLLALFPTHAFTLLPGEKLFREGWEDSGFSYTWIRDRLINPSKKILSEKNNTEALPRVIFGDTNWENSEGKSYFFSFQLDPKTLEIAIYRTTYDGSDVVPMTSWQSFFNGQEPFTVFTRPFQYGGPYTTPRLWQRI